jgi:eukaryotic-like serine/threonine-protein kinase
VSHPTHLGKYQITGVLGEGAMGVVYKGYDPDIRRPVALKTIRRQLVDDVELAANVAARFRNEAQAAGRLSHPGIVGVYEYGEDEQVAYIAMEYVEGQSLARFLAGGVRFTDEDIPGLMSQLLDALEHAHAQGVWHRDIKPANVILSRGGRLKVADFGIARIDAEMLTQTQAMIGTPSYMAPEQFLGGVVDARVDIYAAGVLLYVLLTGQPPFTGPTESLMYRVVNEPALAPSHIQGAQRPGWYDQVVATALAKDPAQRYASAAAFKQAIVIGIGHAFDATAWEQTVIKVPVRAARPVGEGRTGASAAGAGRSGVGAPAPASASVGGKSSGSLPGSLSGSVSGAIDRGSGDGSSGAGSGTPAAWDKQVLARTETALAHFVGPMATVLVRRAARECETWPQLCARLAEHVSDPAERTAFLGRLQPDAPSAPNRPNGGAFASTPGTRPSRPPAPLVLQPEVLDRVQRLLAQHLGPIAKVVVRKASADAPSRAEFVDRLAEAVPDSSARERLRVELERML